MNYDLARSYRPLILNDDGPIEQVRYNYFLNISFMCKKYTIKRNIVSQFHIYNNRENLRTSSIYKI